MAIKPNFFIVGAPKCGTTALATYLSDHPDVYISELKEPNFFCNDHPYMSECANLEAYLSLFAHVKSQKIVGEASTWYLHSEVAVRDILQFNPDAKLISMVRNPVELVYSLYSQYRYNGAEEYDTFEEAWRKQSERRDNWLFQYEYIGKLGARVQKFQEMVPRAQRMVLLFDDLRADARGLYEQVLGFLGLDSEQRTNFAVINQNKALRSEALAKFVRDTPKPVMRVVSAAKKALGIERFGVLERILALNTKTLKREPLPDRLKYELYEVFHDDIKLLERLVHRDLSSWLD